MRSFAALDVVHIAVADHCTIKCCGTDSIMRDTIPSTSEGSGDDVRSQQRAPKRSTEGAGDLSEKRARRVCRQCALRLIHDRSDQRGAKHLG